jgi:hypothetical protein
MIIYGLGGREIPYMPKPKTTYWKQYDLFFKKCSKKKLFKKLKNQSKRIGSPYKKKGKRGRKLKFSPTNYAAFICLQKIFRHRYREMELESSLYLPDRADHSTFARNYEKMPEIYIEDLISSLVEKEYNYLIADSTGINTKIRVERTRQGIRNKEKLADKLHIIIGYDPPNSSTVIIGAKASDWHMSDSGGAVKILKGKKYRAYFFGDSNYNTYELHELIKKCGLIPMIKPDKKGIRKKMSEKAKANNMFCRNFYKNIRGIVETVFGEATNAGLITTFAKKEHCRRLDSLMIALRHNLTATMRLLFRLFYATNSVYSKKKRKSKLNIRRFVINNLLHLFD